MKREEILQSKREQLLRVWLFQTRLRRSSSARLH